MNVVICSAQDEDAARYGIPPIHSLQKKPSSPFARTWIKRAEYRLPDGYAVKEGADGKAGIYNAAGRRCALLDSVYSGSSEGRPILIDLDLPAGKQIVYLSKASDLTLGMLKEMGGKQKC